MAYNMRVGLYKYTEYLDRVTGELRKAYPFFREATLLECLEFDAVDLIQKFRETKDPKFKEQIPAFTPVGLYRGKRLADVKPDECTNLVQIDIDQGLNYWINDWPTLRDELFDQMPSVAVAAISCSGGGVFLLVNTPGWDHYGGYFYAICKYINEKFKLIIDDAVSSPNELRYVTIPNEVRIRDNAEVWTTVGEKPKSEISNLTDFTGQGVMPLIPQSMMGKFHYPDLCSFVGKCNSFGVNKDDVKTYFQLNNDTVFEKSSSLYGKPASVAILIDNIYKKYSNQFGQHKQVPVPKYNNLIKQHCYLIRSIKANNKFAHVIIDNNNICEYYESTAGGRISEPAQQKLSLIINNKGWVKVKNEMLDLFDESLIQRDTADKCYLYFKNGTLEITADNVAFIKANKRPLIWKSLVLDRNYIQTDQVHPIATLGQKVVTDYQKLKIGLGYLLHRYWQRNMTKIVWACDHNPNSDHDGRRGKDLFLKLTEKCRQLTSVKWKKGHNFWTGSITPETSIVHFEDVVPWIANDDEIKRAITGELQIEGKGRDIIVRPFNDKPKFSASCQKIPSDYADESIRGRVWLIEFTDYLQKNPPDKILVYDDGDDLMAAFDAWVVDCIQTYLQNRETLIGVPQISQDELRNVCISNYGPQVVSACYDLKNSLDRQPFQTEVYLVKAWAGLKDDDQIGLDKFKKCYQLLFKETLFSKRVGAEKTTVFYLKKFSDFSIKVDSDEIKCPF